MEVSVDQRLRWLDEGAWEWRFPTVVAPRYLGEPGRVPDADRVAQDVADGPLGARFALSCSIRDALIEGRRPESPSHAVEAVHRRAARCRVELADKAGARLDRDVVVRWRVATPRVGLTLDTGRAADRAASRTPTGCSPSCRPRSDAGTRPGPARPHRAPRHQRLDGRRAAGAGRARHLGAGRHAARRRPARAHRVLQRAAPVAEARRVRDRVGAARRASRGSALRASGRHRDAQRDPGGARQAARRARSGRWCSSPTGRSASSRRWSAAICERLPGGLAPAHGGRGLGGEPLAHRPGGARRATASRSSSASARIRSGPRRASSLGRRRRCSSISPSADPRSSTTRRLQLPDLFAGAPALIGVALRPEGGDLVVRGRTLEGTWEQRLRVAPVDPGQGNPAAVALFGREAVEDLETRLAAGGDAQEHRRAPSSASGSTSRSPRGSPRGSRSRRSRRWTRAIRCAASACPTSCRTACRRRASACARRAGRSARFATAHVDFGRWRLAVAPADAHVGGIAARRFAARQKARAGGVRPPAHGRGAGRRPAAPVAGAAGHARSCAPAAPAGRADARPPWGPRRVLGPRGREAACRSARASLFGGSRTLTGGRRDEAGPAALPRCAVAWTHRRARDAAGDRGLRRRRSARMGARGGGAHHAGRRAGRSGAHRPGPHHQERHGRRRRGRAPRARAAGRRGARRP